MIRENGAAFSSSVRKICKSRLVLELWCRMMKSFRPPAEQLGEPSRLFREPIQSFVVQVSSVVEEAGTGDEGTHLAEVGSFS